MAYRKKIRVNMWSPSSIENAIKELEAEQEHIDKLIGDFLNSLASKVEVFLRLRYPTDIEVSAKVIGNRIDVSAGGEGLLFIEFGTGVPADYSQGSKYGYGAGTWSADHAGTYERWLKYGEFAKADGSYKYDGIGRDAFLQLEGMLHNMVRETAREVFK